VSARTRAALFPVLFMARSITYKDDPRCGNGLFARSIFIKSRFGKISWADESGQAR
jgi:hypothetical protein